MKNFFLLLLLLTAVQTFAQKKGKVDVKQVQIDSLTKASTAFPRKQTLFSSSLIRCQKSV